MNFAECEECNGEGYVTCLDCDEFDEEAECEECDGEGIIECLDCGGSGEVLLEEEEEDDDEG